MKIDNKISGKNRTVLENIRYKIIISIIANIIVGALTILSLTTPYLGANTCYLLAPLNFMTIFYLSFHIVKWNKAPRISLKDEESAKREPSPVSTSAAEPVKPASSTPSPSGSSTSPSISVSSSGSTVTSFIHTLGSATATSSGESAAFSVPASVPSSGSTSPPFVPSPSPMTSTTFAVPMPPPSAIASPESSPASSSGSTPPSSSSSAPPAASASTSSGVSSAESAPPVFPRGPLPFPQLLDSAGASSRGGRSLSQQKQVLKATGPAKRSPAKRPPAKGPPAKKTPTEGKSSSDKGVNLKKLAADRRARGPGLPAGQGTPTATTSSVKRRTPVTSKRSLAELEDDLLKLREEKARTMENWEKTITAVKGPTTTLRSKQQEDRIGYDMRIRDLESKIRAAEIDAFQNGRQPTDSSGFPINFRTGEPIRGTNPPEGHAHFRQRQAVWRRLVSSAPTS